MSFAAIDLAGAPALTLENADGARITVLLRGGQLIAWRGADGVERLYCSPLSPLAGPAAVRGGVPVIFPQFGVLGPIGRHGFARTAAWRYIGHALADTVSDPASVRGCDAGLPHEHGKDNEVGATSTLEVGLDHLGASTPEWPHDCACRLTFTLAKSSLELRFSVRNTGSTPLQFTAALHSYWALPAAASAVRGLLPDGADWPLAGYQDRMLHGVPKQLTVHTPNHILHSETEGFADLVVWNPGANHGLADLPAEGFQDFACVEPANLTPVTLAPGAQWVGRQTVRY